MKINNFARMLVAAAAVTITSLGAYAQQVLYGANGAGGNPATVLVTINTATGVATTVGPIGFAVTGMAQSPITGVMYGSTGGLSPVAPNNIIRIDTTTGVGTLIGPTGFGSPVADIAFRADGTLFGWTESTDELVTINLATGAATVVGPSGTGTSGTGFGISPGGVLYLTGHGATGDIGTVNAATGLYTAGPAMVGSPNNGQMPALAFNSAGVLFASDFAGGGAGGASNLVTVNPATGAITNIGVTISGLDALAFGAPATPRDVPTMSEWSLIAMLLLLLGSGIWFVRRRI